MILRFFGGRRDGLVIDTADPGNWGWSDGDIGADVIQVDACRANLAVYRLADADELECLYVCDEGETARRRLLPGRS